MGVEADFLLDCRNRFVFANVDGVLEVNSSGWGINWDVAATVDRSNAPWSTRSIVQYARFHGS